MSANERTSLITLLGKMGENARATFIDQNMSYEMYVKFKNASPEIRKLLSIKNLPVYELHTIMSKLKQKTVVSLVNELKKHQNSKMFTRMCTLAFEFFLIHRRNMNASHLLQLVPSLLHATFSPIEKPSLKLYMRHTDGIVRTGLDFLLMELVDFGEKEMIDYDLVMMNDTSYEFKEAWCMMNIIKAVIATNTYVSYKFRFKMCELFYEDSSIMSHMLFMYDILMRRKGFDTIKKRTRNRNTPVALKNVFLYEESHERNCPITEDVSHYIWTSLTHAVKIIDENENATFYDVLYSYAVQMFATYIKIKERHIKDMVKQGKEYPKPTWFDFHVNFYEMILETLTEHNLVQHISDKVYYMEDEDDQIINVDSTLRDIKEEYMFTTLCYKCLASVKPKLSKASYGRIEQILRERVHGKAINQKQVCKLVTDIVNTNQERV